MSHSQRFPGDLPRRAWLGGGLALAAASALPRDLRAAPPSDPDAQRLANRLELWQTFARNSETLVARYHSRRESSLLEEALVTDGNLAFSAPNDLVFVDDGFGGAATRMTADRTTIKARQAEALAHEFAHAERPGLQWLARRLHILFAPARAGEGLIDGVRSEVPKGRTLRLTLMPRRDDPARLELRSLTITFDPVGGAPLRLEIAHAQGDQHRLDLSDHRQKVRGDELDRWMGEFG